MKNFLFLMIIAVAAILRLWQLGNVPPSPDWDEAALGYNAYSIMLTGRDEYGTSFPITLRSFDDYKPALYAYLVIPFIKIFGLEVFAVRLPSAIFGMLTVIATYLLVKELFTKNIALIAAGLLAISPWHLQFSRIAFESNVGTALNIFSILFFIKGIKNHRLLILSALFAGLSLHVYQSEKVFLPIIFTALFFIFKTEILAIPKKYIVSSLFVGIILVLPLIFYLTTQSEALLRAKGVSFFSDQTPFLARTVGKLEADNMNKDILGLVLDNRRITYATAALSGYISHFDINWLFLTGDEARHHAPNIGLLYIFELPLVLIGIYTLVFGRFNIKAKLLIFSWILIVPLPASITSGVPHAVRTLNFLPTWQIFSAVGLLTSISAISNYKFKYPIFTFSFLIFTFNFLYFLNQYFIQQNYFSSQVWQYGYEETVGEIKKIEARFDKIIVTNKPHLDQSYMFFLFYLKYPPVLYQNEAKDASGGFRENHFFGKFEFRPIDWEKEEKSSRLLYIGRPEDFPEDGKVIKIIKFLDGKPAIKIVEG